MLHTFKILGINWPGKIPQEPILHGMHHISYPMICEVGQHRLVVGMVESLISWGDDQAIAIVARTQTRFERQQEEMLEAAICLGKQQDAGLVASLPEIQLVADPAPAPPTPPVVQVPEKPAKGKKK